MYLTFYGLTEKPFNATPDPRFLYMSAAHREALAQLLYGDVVMRQYADMDLLVPASEVSRSVAVLDSAGYRPDLPIKPEHLSRFIGDWNELPFRGPADLKLDLHWSLFPRSLAIRLPLEEMRRRGRRHPLGPRGRKDVPVRILERLSRFTIHHRRHGRPGHAVRIADRLNGPCAERHWLGGIGNVFVECAFARCGRREAEL